jgi:CDP-glycerol glycerophosphotransferase (TagB/SpsB family)
MVWRRFENDKDIAEVAEKYEFSGSKNVMYVGNPRMDDLYDMGQKTKPAGSRKRIIFAPHHTIVDGEGVLVFSTFEYNFRYMIELAKKYEGKVEWVFRPHPNLMKKAVAKGIFKDEAAWNEYLDEWRSIEGSTVEEFGTYTEMFAASDAMILDCVSFMAEYLYTGKPSLLLTRPEQRFSKIGKDVKAVLYQADGKDFTAIEAFVRDVVLGGDDTKKPVRDGFFAENLDYRSLVGDLAYRTMYREFEKVL